MGLITPVDPGATGSGSGLPPRSADNEDTGGTDYLGRNR
jgi:hypothetical protein